MTRRAKGRAALAMLADIKRARSALVAEKASLELRLSSLDLKEADAFSALASNDTDAETGRKHKKGASPAISSDAPDELAVQMARAVAKVLR